MHAPGARADPGIYPEREPARSAALDRLFGEIAFRVRLAFGRDLRPQASLWGEVARHAAGFRGGESGGTALAAQVPALRYRLRRDGLQGQRLAESFGIACAALAADVEPPAAPALDAAAALVRGGIVDLADAAERWQALALAACAFALCGVPVHFFTATEARSRAAAEALRGPLGALGLQVGCVTQDMDTAARRAAYAAPVVCGSLRVIAMDYLRDRLRLGRRRRPLQGRLERIGGGLPDEALLMLGGLRCALVEDGDLVLIDDSRTPMVISAEGGASSPDRLLYEQALELAAALEAPADFTLADGAAKLQGRGAQRLAQLSSLLGGAWAARQAREALVASALTALHALQRGRDYEVAQDALQFPSAGGPREAPPHALLRLLELKEGLPFGGRREILARLSVPSFFRRYLRLGGTCADAGRLEKDFWVLYGLRCARAGWRPAPRAIEVRVFVTSAARRAALVAAAREQGARGRAVLIALRSVKEGEALADALREAGVAFALMQGAATLAELERPGAVLLSLHPAQRGVARLACEVPLHLIVAELHESARHVAQIARAYAASSCEQFLALEDPLVAAGLGPLAARLARAAAGPAGELPAARAARAARRAQRSLERVAARERADLALREQSLEETLAFSGRAQ
jgi:preprotein translocase subunit SecA